MDERNNPSWCLKCDTDDWTHHAPQINDHFCTQCGEWTGMTRTTHMLGEADKKRALLRECARRGNVSAVKALGGTDNVG